MALAFGDTDDEVSVVGVDDLAGARLAAQHLTDLGHRRFAILAMEFGEGHAGRVGMERVEAADYATTRERVMGYFEALAAVGVDTSRVPIFETTADPATIDAALEAILAQSDRIAMRALDWLGGHGLAVPGEVSVIGFDGVPEGASSEPPLTTVSQPIRALGRRAVEVIVERTDAIRREVLDVELVVRGSTAPPPGKPA